LQQKASRKKKDLRVRRRHEKVIKIQRQQVRSAKKRKKSGQENFRSDTRGRRRAPE
jgi:hypothetical protein